MRDSQPANESQPLIEQGPDDQREQALSKIMSYVNSGYSLDDLRKSGWGDWIDDLKAAGYDVSKQTMTPRKQGGNPLQFVAGMVLILIAVTLPIGTVSLLVQGEPVAVVGTLAVAVVAGIVGWQLLSASRRG